MCFGRRTVLSSAVAGFLLLGLPQPGNSQPYLPAEGYYDGAEHMLGSELKQVLHDIIDNHVNLGYDAMRLAPRVLDQDPDDADNVILIYSGLSVPGWRYPIEWNREHSWPQSFGADASLKPGADFHHLFPCDPGVNSDRSNLIFDWTNPGELMLVPNAPGSTKDSNSFEPRDEDKGRIARAMLYMDLRYDAGDGYGDFNLGEAANQGATRMAKLSTLLAWHRLFPPDERELRRNHLIDQGFVYGSTEYKQGNRNPFIDFPDLADAVFTSQERVAWGTWRWSRFAIEQLQDPEISGELVDPDEDFLVNLLEYSANLDPGVPNDDQLLSVFQFPGFGTQLRFTLQKAHGLDGISYVLERSATPLREETWEVITEEEYSSLSITDSDPTELVTVTLPSAESREYYRLLITRTLGEESTAAVYDPHRTRDTTGSLFVYQDKIGDSPWKESPWMGYLNDDDYPWIYHVDHQWLYIEAARDDAVWIYDSTVGWVFTNSEIYPYLYHLSSAQWIYYQLESTIPNRWFYVYGHGWVQEPEWSTFITTN